MRAFLIMITLIAGCLGKFNQIGCGVVKGCYLEENIWFSYRIIGDDAVEFEISFKTEYADHMYGAVGFSPSGRMFPARVIECSSRQTEPFSMKFSRNVGRENERIDSEEELRGTAISNTESGHIDGMAYCKGTIGAKNYSPDMFNYVPGEQFYLIMAMGEATLSSLLKHSVKFRSPKKISLDEYLKSDNFATKPSYTDGPQLSPKSQVFDTTGCATIKGCFTPNEDISMSYKMANNDSIEFEIFFKAESRNGIYAAIGFSSSGSMFPAPVIECSSLGTEQLSMKFSYNEGRNNIRIEEEEKLRTLTLNDTVASFENGYAYCKGRVSNKNVHPKIFRFDPSETVYLLLAMGTTTPTGLDFHGPNRFVSSHVNLAEYSDMNETTRLWKVPFHAVLMTIAWTICVPTAILAARLLRSSWPDTKPCNLLIWFHIHRTCNMSAIVLIVIAFFIIFSHKDWKIDVTGDYGGMHALCGLCTIVLTISQPIISIFRCGPKDRNRPIFNVIHRTIGLVALSLASLAIGIATAKFANRPKVAFLVLVPSVLLVLISAIYAIYDGVKREKPEPENGKEGEEEEEVQDGAAVRLLRHVDVGPIPPDPEDPNILDQYREAVTFIAISIFVINGVYMASNLALYL